MAATAEKQPLFRDLNPDDNDQESTIIDSVCVNCFENGVTRLLLTKIPFYKEVVLMSFHCEHCGFQNNEIQSACEIQPKGIRITTNIINTIDLNRKIVKSDFTAVTIPEVNLEIPAQSQKGEVTTVEGIIARTISGLTQDQEARRSEHPDTAKAIDEFIQKLEDLKTMSKPFTLIMEDISGNCFVENPNAPRSDSQSKSQEIIRNNDQNKLLGLYENTSDTKELTEKSSDNGTINIHENSKILKPIPEGSWPLEELHGEVLQFNTLCSNCNSPCETNMKVTKIPHFKEVVIMATNCEICGCRTNEVKSGSGIEDKGVRFEVKIKCKEDLTRDVLKADTCSMNIPELICDVGPSALGGRFTTVEGILIAMKEQIMDNGSMFQDSSDLKTKEKFQKFVNDIGSVISLERAATLILDDPAGNSYVQSLNDSGPDDRLLITRYTRSFDQNEELGLNDMKTENY